MKRLGFSDRQLAELRGTNEAEIRVLRHRLGIRPAYKTVDTCAGEFPSSTPYLYSSYDEENEARGVGDRTVVILGSGPNRIGQGVEFDYCCVRAAMAFRQLGYRTVMVNSNPETVSTDFDISDALYFEPLTLEDVLEIVNVERPLGVVVQLGGQTPLRLARALEREGVRILGTSPEAIDLAEDRGRFEALSRELGVAQPPSGVAHSVEEAVGVATRVGYPVLVRPSYVLGGRAMEIVYDDASLRSYFERAARVAPEHPVLIDSFLEDAFEADVDAIADGTRCVIGGVMQHIEDAGIHSGDSACVLPPYLITEAQVQEMRRHTRAFAERLGVVGLINVQYAIKNGVVYVLEVNPRGSRTVPVRLQDHRRPARQSRGRRSWWARRLDDLGLQDDVLHPYVAVKEAVFPFSKLQGVDLVLGPEMRSTGEVMGIADSFGMAFAKAQISADGALPHEGGIFVTVNDHDKANLVPIARRFHALGFRMFGTEGTARYLRARGIPTERVLKVHEGRPERHRPPGVGSDRPADQHAAGQAHPEGRLRDPARRAAAPGGLHDDAVGRGGRLRRHHRPAQPAGRGAVAAGVARARAGDVAGMDRLTARDAAFVAALRARVRGQVKEAEPLARYSTYRIGGPATVLHPGGRRGRRNGAHDGARGRHSMVRRGPRLEHPSARRRSRRAGDPDGQGDGPPAPGRRALDGGRRDCPRRWPPGGRPPPASPGLHIFVGVPGTVGGGVYMNAGCHGGDWSEVVESVTVVDETGRDAVLPRASVPFTYRRSGLDGRVVLETTVRLRPEEQHAAGRADRRDVRVAPEGHAVQPALLRQRLQEPVGAELETGRRPPDGGAADRGRRAQGPSCRRRRDLADARELFREHRRGHGRGRASA